MTVLWMSVITGFLIEGFGWQKTFIIEGLPSVVWALVWIALVSDRPVGARWMTREAAEHLEGVLAEEQALVRSRIGAVVPVRQALLRRDVLLLSVVYFCWSLGGYGFVLWLPTIVKEGSALAMGKVGLLSAVPYLFGIGMMVVVSQYSDKTRRREAVVWPFLLLGGIGLMGSFALAQRSFAAAFVCLVIGAAGIYAPYGPFFAIIPERLPRSVAGEVMALINSCGALGGFVGTYFVGFLRAVTGNSRAGFLLMSVALICSAVLLLFLSEGGSCENGARGLSAIKMQTISAAQVLESERSVFAEAKTHAPGPEGRLPITAEMLLTEPSGNLFGLDAECGHGVGAGAAA